jgi:ribosomal protein S27AE
VSAADCPTCEAMGYRACDECGNPVFPPFHTDGFGRDLCGYCLHPVEPSRSK